jgi:hypothetical protein
MVSRSFGRLAYQAAQAFEDARIPVTVANVAIGVASFFDEHVASAVRLQDLSDQFEHYTRNDESKAVRALETRVKVLIRQNEALEHSLGNVSTALASHVTYVESLTREWKNGLTEAQQGAASADQRAREAIELGHALRSNVTSLGGRLTQGRGLTFYRQTFALHNSFVDFAKINKIGLGCVGDAFLLMHGDAVGVVSNEESLAVKKASLDNKLATGLQGLVVSSFTTSIPAAFAPSKSATAAAANSTKDVLKRSAPQFEAWEDEQCAGGLRFRLEKAVLSCRARVDMSIENSDMTPQARELCTRVTSDSERFAMSLIEFITRLYPTTKKTSGPSDEVIWELCIELLSYILDEIVKARNGFSDAGEAHPAYFLWGMLQAWEIQQRYLSHKFMDDPALNGIFVRRAVLRSMDAKVVAQVRELMNRVASLEKAPVANKTPAGGRKRGKNGAEEKEDEDEDVK